MTEAATETAEIPLRQGRLTRLRLAFVRRDWMGVAIEIAIVTLGILLAFEIEQWGERRSKAADERQFLARLYAEYGRAADELKSLQADHERVRHDVRLAFAQAGNPAALRQLSNRPDFGCGLARFRDAPFNDTSFEELVASGRINIISDPRLRADIRDLAAAQAASAKQIDSSRVLMMSQMGALDDHTRFRMLPSGEAVCTADWPALLADQKARNAALRAYRVNGFSLDARRAVLQRMSLIRHQLACTLEKPECRQ